MSGEFTSALTHNGRPHVLYWDRTNGNLRHAYYTGTSWLFETLDGEGGANGRINTDVGPFTSTVLYKDRVHVFYWDRTSARLRHGYLVGPG
ncbi:MAG: hypothetical protein M5U31_16395 [Acidimicrobiia bacterium]|nr:hypothetical protein [Acidimicrobiia bacterium]